MPFEAQSYLDAGMRAPGLIQPPEAPEGSLFAAATRQENTIASVYNYMADRTGFTYDPDHNPIDLIKDTKYEASYLHRFVDSRSAGETQARMRRIDQEEDDKRLLDAGGFAGFIAQATMGLADPTILLPMGIIYRGVRMGSPMLKSAASGAGFVGAQSALQESILYGTHETRTGAESTMHIATGAIVGALLGSAASYLTSKQLANLTDNFTAFRNEVNAEIASGGAGAVGAESARREFLTLASAVGAEKALGFLTPVTRLQRSSLARAKAFIRDAADAGLSYRENYEGVVTSAGGTVETRIKMRRGPLIEAVATQDDAYSRYFFGKADVSAFERRSAAMRSEWASVTGQLGGKLTAREFREEVGRAMRRGDEHPIPEIAEAAKAFREKVFEPLKKEAIKLGLLPEDVKVLGADSYLTRVYNREMIKARRDQFHGILLRHFTGLRDTASKKFEEKKAKTVAALELEHADLTTPAAARPALMAKLEADLDQHLTSNPSFVTLDQNLKDLRARAGKAATAEEKAALRAEEKAARTEAGPEYAQYVATRNQLAARMARLNRTEPASDAAAVAPGTRPKKIAALKAAHKSELGELEKRLDEVMDTHAHARDKELEQAKSIAAQRSAGASRREKTVITGHLREAEARIALAHADIVAKESKPFVRLIRDLKKKQTRELKDAREQLSSVERSTDRAADLAERIGSERAKRSTNELVESVDAEMPDIVNGVINAILGESVFRLPGIAVIAGEKGPLRKRILNIPDAAIEEFLESDVEKVARVYSQSMASDIELAAKFGDVRLESVLKELTDEFNMKVDRLPKGPAGDKPRKRMSKDFEQATKDIGAIRDRLRGNYRQPGDPEGIAYRAGKVALNLNYVARLGGMTISSLSDAGRPIMRYGMNAFRDGWIPLLTDLRGMKLAAREVRLAGTALDMVRDQRALELADVLDDFGRGNKFERATQWGADRFGMLALMSPWNGAGKSMAGIITMAEVLRAVEAVAKGTATQKQIGLLNAGGISTRRLSPTVDDSMAARIAAHSERSGTKTKGGIHLPNTEDWKLPNGSSDIEAIEAFRAVVNREVETLIVTPGVERPLWMSHSIGRILGQFKTFAMVSTQRTTLAGLQQRDGAALMGVVSMMALGALSSWTKAQIRGEDTSTWTQGKWTVEALDNSGLLGVLMEANNIVDKLPGGPFALGRLSGKTVSRYQSRNLVGALGGPSLDAVGDLATMTRLASPTQKWSGADTHAIRKIMPLQNLFYLRTLFDKVEEGINNSMGIPQRRPRH